MQKSNQNRNVEAKNRESNRTVIIPINRNTTIGHQAFSHDGCNIFAGFSYNKANNTFFNSLRKNEVEAQVEFTLKNYGKGLGHLLLISQLRETVC